MVNYEKNRASYTMKTDKVKKIVHLAASGFFSIEDGESFINDYEKIVKSIPTQDFVLVIDISNDLKPSSPDVAKILAKLLKRYIEVPFKKRFLTSKGNVVAVAQFKRLGKSIPGWQENVEYVNDLNEVYQKL
ncbi:hypothetical protein [Caldisalinibacter kiritimatiensis]|uniref:STAS/SEC14 domain-containing protein n=1 Tax=Caldisalinibacter kiritimatiensis TaxID=1304284 RepID=R1AUZ5_9FIRM|nr:hypothetical protein [Caldisalinibacter kiritimatiensis]EOD00452.1 hypothetical protein L21TH_1513 [Caldisalinibacter kiritimatiensis]